MRARSEKLLAFLMSKRDDVFWLAANFLRFLKRNNVFYSFSSADYGIVIVNIDELIPVISHAEFFHIRKLS